MGLCQEIAVPVQKKIQLIVIELSPQPLREGEEGHKNSLKPPKDIYKASLKSKTNSDQHFIDLEL